MNASIQESEGVLMLLPFVVVSALLVFGVLAMCCCFQVHMSSLAAIIQGSVRLGNGELQMYPAGVCGKNSSLSPCKVYYDCHY